jgi:autotransporter-associated beta strand protein
VLQRHVTSIPYLLNYGVITNHLMLGANQNNIGGAPTTFFAGLLYDARLYNYPLSSGEVQYLVTAGQISSKDIFTFNFPGLSATTISGTNINITVPFTTDITALSPTYLCSALATCSPPSGTTRNFTSPQTYTVTAQDSSTKTYKVTVTKSIPSSACDILSVNWGAYSSVTLGTNITLLVPAGTAVTALNPTVTVSPFASVSPASGSTNDFTSPVNYTVTAEDGVSTKIYAVGVLPQYSWTNSAGGAWSIGGNWNPNSVPASANNTVLAFNTAGTYSSTHDLGDGFQLNLLLFGAPAVTLDGNSLQFVGANPEVLNKSLVLVVVSNSLDLPVDTTFANVGGLRLSGVVSGTGALVKNGAGTLTLASANTYSGGTTVNAGFLALANTANDYFGTGQVIINSPAQLSLNGNGNLPNAFTFNGVMVVNGNSFSANLNGPVTLTGTTTFDLGTTGNMRIGGNVSGPGGLTKIGTGLGPLVLSGTNTYTGPTTVTAGTLRCDNPNALGSGALSIASGATVNLNFTGGASVSNLTIAGVIMPNGIYGSTTNSSADITNAAFLGAGTLTVGPQTQALIKSFVFPGYPAATIDQTNRTITLTNVPYADDVTALAPTYTVSPFASATPASDTSLDFSTPQTYTVISGDTTVTNVYTVTVTKIPASSSKDILTFDISGNPGVITGTNIVVQVPSGTDVTLLTPTYTVSALASGSPVPGTTVDFSTPQIYTITAQDGSQQQYLVAVVFPSSPIPTITGITGPVAGEFTIAGSTDIAGNVVVLMATNLVPLVTWTPIQTNAVSGGAFSIPVPQGSDSSAFYRLMGQ